MFNCLDCKPGFWGGYAVPPHPRGAYRVLAQLQDAMGCPRRLYASALADCAGIIEKHDNLWPIDLDIIFHAAAGVPAYAPAGFFFDGHGLSGPDTAINAYNFFAGHGGVFPLWAWQCFWRPGAANPIRLLAAHSTSTVWTWMDTVTAVQTVHPAFPADLGAALGWMLIIQHGDVFGEPWFNAI